MRAFAALIAAAVLLCASAADDSFRKSYISAVAQSAPQKIDIRELTVKCIDRMKPGQQWPVSLYMFPGTSNENIIWTSDNETVASVSDGVVYGISDGTAVITAQGERSGISGSVTVRVDSDLKQIALTFDDGPGNSTMKLLKALDELDVRCTFFLCGYRISSYPDTIRRMAEDGHEIGFHSWSHGRLKNMSEAKIRKEYNDFQSALLELVGKEASVWRCPYGEADDYVRRCVELPECLWNVDTMDWQYQNPKRLERVILENARDGAVILCHDLYDETVDGVIYAVTKLASREDVQFLTATEFFERDGERLQCGRCYR